jgi:uncharacterized protein GlcG (DUF336 family)
MRMKRLSIAAGLAWALALAAGTAQAQVARSGYALPVSLAMEAAAEAIRVCESNGYAVSASVLGVGGAPGGDKDEACARAGVAKIQDRVTAAAQKRAS